VFDNINIGPILFDPFLTAPPPTAPADPDLGVGERFQERAQPVRFRPAVGVGECHDVGARRREPGVLGGVVIARGVDRHERQPTSRDVLQAIPRSGREAAVNDDHFIERRQRPALRAQTREQPGEAALDVVGIGAAARQVVGFQHQSGRRQLRWGLHDRSPL
jgi:hypothetical protein